MKHTIHNTPAEEVSAPVEYATYVEGSRVIIRGREVPYLLLHGDMLVLDQRLGLELPTDEKARDSIVEFVANAIAVGGGYASIYFLDSKMPFR